MEKFLKYVEARALDNNKVADLCNDLINSDFMQLKNDFERRNYIRSIGKEHPVTSGAVQQLLLDYDKIKDSL